VAGVQLLNDKTLNDKGDHAWGASKPIVMVAINDE
jgi:hypothetical protein